MNGASQAREKVLPHQPTLEARRREQCTQAGATVEVAWWGPVETDNYNHDHNHKLHTQLVSWRESSYSQQHMLMLRTTYDTDLLCTL